MRDRHGRLAAADSDGRRRPPPGYRVPSGRRFMQVVADAVGSLPSRLASPLYAAELAVEDIPPRDWDGVALAEFRTASGGRPAMLTIYRRPLEARSDSRLDLIEAVRIAVGEAVARALGITDLDDLY